MRGLITGLVVFFAAACGGEREAAPDGAAVVDSPAAAVVQPSSGAPGCVAKPAPSNRLICLPERVGPVTRTTTRAQLAQWFGESALRDGPIEIGEGDTAPGTFINGGRPDSVAVIWADSARAGVSGVVRLGPAWKTAGGVGVGSTLEEIERAFGAVHLLGYGWDYGGTVLLPETDKRFGVLFLRTEPTAEASAARARIRGDQPFPASDPDVRALKPIVRAIDVSWR